MEWLSVLSTYVLEKLGMVVCAKHIYLREATNQTSSHKFLVTVFSVENRREM
jgi:hypothetical protein